MKIKSYIKVYPHITKIITYKTGDITYEVCVDEGIKYYKRFGDAKNYVRRYYEWTPKSNK